MLYSVAVNDPCPQLNIKNYPIKSSLPLNNKGEKFNVHEKTGT